MVDKSSIDLREIIKKTGHNLEEIRLRALENILSKLRNGIISIEDLIHHRDLMVNLLQWFNHENPPRIRQVLELLQSLTKHGAAVSLLQSLGGVEFFSTLRQDLSEDEHLELVDSILDSIFWIHDEKSQVHMDRTADETVKLNWGKPLQMHIDERENAVIFQSNINGIAASGSRESTQNSSASPSIIEKPLLHQNIKPSIDANVKQTGLKHITSKASEGKDAIGQPDCTMEWIVLTSSDRHILSVTESRLQSHSMDLVCQSCEFFRDVLLQDFPTHIFIQRPNIVKILLSLLDIYSQKGNAIVAAIIECLNDLTVNLAKSLLQQASPDLSQISKLNETYSSSASSVNTELSSLHSRTTNLNGEGNSVHSGNTVGREVQSNIGSDPEDFEGAILTEALQQSQWTAVAYCFHLISNVISLIERAIEGANRCDGAVILLNNVLNLLCLHDVKSSWTSESGEREVYDVMTCLRHFGHLIQLCLDKKEAVTSQPWNPVDVETIFPLLGNITAISIRFINLSIPYEKVYEGVPESLLSSYKILFADEILAQIYPSIRASLHCIMKAAEEEFYHHFQNASTVISSMQATMNFLHEINKKTANMNKAASKWLSLCDVSILSVGFHQHEIFIKSSLNMIANLFSMKNSSANITSKAKDILLRLLSHKKDQIKVLAYAHCLDIVMSALSENHVTNPLSTSYQKALFLINTNVLEEIVSFGIGSTNKEITNFAVNIVVTLLLGRLSMPSQVWQNVIYSIIPVLPQLQCFAGMDKALARALATMSDSSNALLGSDGESYSLPPLEQLRASLRFMFVKDDNIRARGFSSVIWTLSQEDVKSGSAIRYPHEVVQNASDMFLVSPAISTKYQIGEKEQFGFSGSSLDQLWDVFASSTVDDSLRESAAEQLSVLVQDTTLHKQFLEHDADKYLLQSIREHAKQANFYSSVSVEKNSKMVQSCITILRYLVQYNASLRHILAVNRNLLLDIIRCRIACNDNEMIHFEASCLIMLLVFDEILGINGNQLTLPLLMAKRYVLPLHCKTQEMTTAYRQKTSKDDMRDMGSLEEEPLYSMIRISWNVILTGEDQDEEDRQLNSSETLPLSSTEAKLLRELRNNCSVRRHLNILLNSESVSALVTAMQDLGKHVTSSACHLNTGEIIEDITHYIEGQAMLKRLLKITASKSKTVFLQSIISLCHMIASVESHMIPPLSRSILAFLLETKGPVSATVSNYTMFRMQETDVQRDGKGTYDLTNENRILFKSILLLVSSLCLKMNSVEEFVNYADFDGIGDFVFLLVQTLSRVDSTRYYDLPVLESTLDCLSHLTYKRGWSMQFSGNGEELCGMMADVFIQILYSFHIDRIGASTSFMGKGVIAKAALGLCHVAMENQTYCGNKDWTISWVSRNLQQGDEVIENDLPWLLPLLTDRVLDIRWCGWSLSTALLNGIIGAESVVNEFQVFPGGVWASAVGVILDEFENPLVRTQACRLISIALAKLKESGKQSVDRKLWESMIVQDTQTQENISGVPAFLLLLDHFHFFSKVKEQLMQNIGNSPSAPSMTSYQNVSTSCSTLATDTEYAYESIISDTNDDISSEGSTSALTLQSGNGIDRNPGGSSSECLLQSSKDSLNSDQAQIKQTFSRYPVDDQLKAAKKNVYAKCRNPTPRFKAAIFQLLSTLIEIDPENVILSLDAEGFINVLMRTLDSDLIISYFTKSTLKLSSIETKAFRENVDMITNVLKVINLVAIHHRDAYITLDGDQIFTYNLVSLFRLPTGFAWSSTSMNSLILSLWNEALRILMKMCYSIPGLIESNIEKEVFKNLHILAVSFAYAASMKKIAQTTIDLFLVLFTAVFCKEGRRAMTERTLPGILDSACLSLNAYMPDIKPAAGNDIIAGSHLTLGEYLSTLLINISNTFSVASPGRKTALSSLSSLFVVSRSSKITAVDNGYLESIIEDMKDIHVKLNLASLQLSKDDHQNKMEKTLLNELASIFHLLRNLVHANGGVKDVAAQSGLLTSIKKMWSWCMMDQTLKLSLLEFLATLACNCAKAQEFICHGGTSSSRQTHDDNSMFHSIIKLLVILHKDAMAPTGKIEKSLKITFHLLTNLAIFSESRSLIWKCNFMQHFKSSQVGQSANKKQKVASKVLTALWAQFILVLSFFADGANAILKVDGMLPTLIAFASEDNHRERQKSLLILRNLLFFPAIKPSLITNGQLVSCLLKAIDIKSIWSKSIVVSCFASLLHNCHKAKVALKKTRLLGKLQLLNEDVLSGKILSMDGDTKGYEQLKLALKKTIDSLIT